MQPHKPAHPSLWLMLQGLNSFLPRGVCTHASGMYSPFPTSGSLTYSPYVNLYFKYFIINFSLVSHWCLLEFFWWLVRGLSVHQNGDLIQDSQDCYREHHGLITSASSLSPTSGTASSDHVTFPVESDITTYFKMGFCLIWLAIMVLFWRNALQLSNNFLRNMLMRIVIQNLSTFE